VSRADLDGRNAALTAFLEERAAAGYLVETRTATQAVIVRRGTLFRLGRIRRGRAEDRLVVSVDSDGAITATAAEPRRW
jgi:hypothetical protein